MWTFMYQKNNILYTKCKAGQYIVLQTKFTRKHLDEYTHIFLL